ncbi:MAG TPA: FHA domain-containing protein [Planctomycetota bacterium]|nr:FHA domain-containing protein [Planctomycetota bacterium]
MLVPPLAGVLGLDATEWVAIICIATVFTGVGWAIAIIAGRKKGAAEPAEAPDRARFAAAFQKTPVPTSAPVAAGPQRNVHDLIDESAGESTMAMRVVPDTSPAPMPGFADVYRKMASGEIRGHVMVVGGPDRGRGVEIVDQRVITVGRGKNHTLNLADPGVSTDQCEFTAVDGKILLRDLGSKNGTFVNNQRIDQRPHPLENCDIVTCGATKILMTLPG